MVNEKFENYFKEIFGKRWETLRESLLKEELQIAFSTFEKSTREILQSPKNFLATKISAKERTNDAHLKNYILDPASLVPIYALDVQCDSQVLDLCAAPGGKSLAILGQLGPKGKLVANDSSKDRMIRLKKVLREYSPEKMYDHFQVFLSDGRTFFKRTKEKFDRILVDAPCSSERHLLKNEKLLAQWTPKQAQSLAIKQYTLLCTALLCADSNAKIVYSTCSINPVENDDVIEKILKKKSDQCELDLPDLSDLGFKIEKTKLGFWILPDETDFGPIYLSRLRSKT